MTAEVETLVVALIEAAALPEKAVEDAFHIAIATVHGMDFLLTWNCKHIANAIKRGIIERVWAKRLDMQCQLFAHRKNCWEKEMWTDPIVEEIHAQRREHAAQFGFDPHKIFSELRKLDETPSPVGDAPL